MLEYLDLRLQDPRLPIGDALAARASDTARDPKMINLPESVQRMLTNLGVPVPGSETAKRVAEGVLEYHIYEVMTRDETWRAMWPYSEHEYARAYALQQMDPVGNTARICAVTRSWSMIWIVPKNECAPLLRQ